MIGSHFADFEYIDSFLHDWFRFADGANELVPKIKAATPRVEQELAQALVAGDKRAPGRLVYFMVVQVGGSVDVRSELGQACKILFGPDVAPVVSKQGRQVYFAGDIFFWWQRHAAGFSAYPALESWMVSEFAQSTVIPMYRSACAQP